jgi:hypothetical protein
MLYVSERTLTIWKQFENTWFDSFSVAMTEVNEEETSCSI